MGPKIVDLKEMDASETRDLGLASFVLASGKVTLAGTRTTNGRVYFSFAPGDEFDRLRAAWHTGDDSVSARAFFDASRLKVIIHEIHDGRPPRG